MYRLYFSFEIGEYGDWREDSEKACKIIGCKPSSAGTRFGQRDMEWDFDTHKSAMKAALKLLKGFSQGDIQIDEIHEDESRLRFNADWE